MDSNEFSDATRDLQQEVARQDAKWGEQNHNPLTWLAILGEEYGEACKAVLENPTDSFEGYAHDVLHELLHFAAVAMQARASLRRRLETK